MQPLGRLTEARRLLKRHFGYDGFRPAQLRVIGPLLAGRDVLAVLPTGGGKSVCFQIPALLGGGLTLVVSPLISLMQDQVAALRFRNVPAGMLNRSVSADEERETLRKLRAGELRLLYIAPERAQTLLPMLPPVRLLAIDEAHCVSEWGLSFRPAYRKLGLLRRRLGRPQTIALTGSATPAVRRDIIETLGLQTVDTVLGSFDRPNLSFEVQRLRSDASRTRAISEFLKQRDAVTLIYAPTRRLVEDITRHLLDRGVKAAPYHAGLDHDSRRTVLHAFLSNRLQVVVATSAFGMGIDKPDVRLVLHWGPPPALESYYQEAGRAGRDGAPARCVLLYTRRDVRMRYAQLKSAPKERRAAERARLDAMVRYTTGRTCRRAAMLGYFGELVSACTGCDRCRAFITIPAPRVRIATTAPEPHMMAAVLAWRRRIARKLDVPEHAVLDDATVGRIAAQHPVSDDALADVEGVGPALVARWGGSLLRVLRKRNPDVSPRPTPEPVNPALYEALAAWRSRVSRDAALPVYCVTTNRALRGVAESLPTDADALAQVPGIGPKVLAKHGRAILELVESYRASQPNPRDRSEGQ